MHEASNDSTQQASGSARWFVVMVGILSFVAGALLARGLFPVEVPRTVVVEKEKRVEVPVERIVEKRVEVPVEKVVEKIVERRVELPVAAVAQVPATSSQGANVNADKVSSVASAVGMASWGGLSLGMTQRQVSELIGKPQKVEGVDYAIWWYGGMRVSFAHGKLCHWSDPAR